MMKNRRIAVIGAGVAGLSCSQKLGKAGHDVTVFEKSRGLGGRVATRRTPDGLFFDHGAPFISNPNYAPELETRLTGDELVNVWQARPENAAYVGVPAMNTWLKPLAENLTVQLQSRITEITATEDQWRLTVTRDDGTNSFENFDQIISTVPAPQAMELFGALPGFTGVFDKVEMTPCWTLMVAFAERLDIPLDFQEAPGPDVAKLMRNSAKPGREPLPDCWVLQATEKWSISHLEEDKEAAHQLLLSILQDIAGFPLPTPVYKTAHRWRYALTKNAYGVPFLPHPDGSIYLGGDWLLGDSIAHAWRSGSAIADALIQTD
ncbi:MAG: FAD-dependent oxidoreductase [Aquisalinus sp.]|nr:FAD-dependent oxidoreductase [Aquisalinus sp.]